MLVEVEAGMEAATANCRGGLPDSLVRDGDFHPGEPFVRLFSIPGFGVLRLDDQAFVYQTRFGDAVLRHYAFANEWFKVNVTFDPDGTLIETPAASDDPPFAFNCDIATPMYRSGRDVFAVDLFADVLVRADGRTFLVKDEDELAHAAEEGLVSQHEFASARDGLARLVGLIEADGLIPFLHGTFPLGPSDAPEGMPMTQVPLADVPEVQPERRWTWQQSG